MTAVEQVLLTQKARKAKNPKATEMIACVVISLWF